MRVLAWPIACVLASAACESPTAPDTRTGVVFLVVSCAGDGSAPLECRARTTCTGYCTAPQNARLRDVTAQSEWIVAGTAVRHVGLGRFESVHVGDVAISAAVAADRLQGGNVTVGVFPGLHPMPTTSIAGRVGVGTLRDSPLGPQPVWERMINGARVEIIDGPVGGRWQLTGERPSAPPGFLFSFPRFGDGEFLFLGVPGARDHELEIRASGFGPVRRRVSLPFSFSSPFVDVVLP